MGPAQPLVGASEVPTQWQPISVSNPDDPAQTLDSSAVGATHKQPSVKNGQ